MSAREDLENLLMGDLGMRGADADRIIDAYAHELAEEIRDESPQYNSDWTCWNAAADLIDPEVES